MLRCAAFPGRIASVPYRKSMAQVKFRLRKELLNKIKRSAERNDRPMTEELAAIFEDAFDNKNQRQEWQEDRERWFTALRFALENYPAASEAAVLKLKELDDKIEREAQKDLMSDLRKGD